MPAVQLHLGSRQSPPGGLQAAQSNAISVARKPRRTAYVQSISSHLPPYRVFGKREHALERLGEGPCFLVVSGQGAS